MNAVPRGLPVLWIFYRQEQTINWGRNDGKPLLGKSTLYQ